MPEVQPVALPPEAPEWGGWSDQLGDIGGLGVTLSGMLGPRWG